MIFKVFALATVALLTLFAPAPSFGGSEPPAPVVSESGQAPSAATAAAAAILRFPESDCPGFPGFIWTSNVTFNWAATGEGLQWLDISIFDNGFAPGTFVSLGPLGPDVSSVNWNDMVPNVAHFWRVNTRTADGWSPSAIIPFVPCGSPKVIEARWYCTGDGRADVLIRWAPTSSPVHATWIDLSLSFNGFAPGTFIGAGPIPASDYAFLWRGVKANEPHYYRSHALNAFGWFPSQTGMFTARC
jgi:hypothetical protein